MVLELAPGLEQALVTERERGQELEPERAQRQDCISELVRLLELDLEA
jgi:hypothetical protein